MQVTLRQALLPKLSYRSALPLAPTFVRQVNRASHESLDILRGVMIGKPVDFDSEFSRIKKL